MMVKIKEINSKLTAHQDQVYYQEKKTIYLIYLLS